MGAEKVFSGLPPWAKGVVAVAGTGIFAFIGYKIYSSINERIKHASDYKEKEEVKNDLKDLANQGIKPSYSDSQYLMWANKIFTALDGYETDELAVYGVLSNMKNNSDVLKLINAYGIKTISSGKGNLAPDYTGTLAGALTEEMNSDEIGHVNKILSNRGIKIKF